MNEAMRRLFWNFEYIVITDSSFRSVDYRKIFIFEWMVLKMRTDVLLTGEQEVTRSYYSSSLVF